MSGLEDADPANKAALSGCDRPHRFFCIRPRDDGGIHARYRCRQCGGEVGEVAFAWYARGWHDGTKDAERRLREAPA